MTLKNFLKTYGVRMIVVILSVLFLCSYINRKEGYHMDEILAFQLANAEFNPWIVPTQPVGRLAKFMDEHIDGDTLGETISNMAFIVKDTLTNKGGSILANYKADVYDAPVWIDKEAFQNYVQCNEKDDYNLLSVYFNIKGDVHPPFHYMLIHIASSLFKGEISVWHGAIINLAAAVGILWLLGLIGDIVFQKKSSSTALVILYGFSMAIVSSTIWLRMYALVTLWVMWSLYLHIRKFNCVCQDSFLRTKQDGKIKWLSSAALFTATVFTFWTQYFGLFFIIPLAAITVILLWKEKRIPEIWAYIRTMVTAAIVGIMVFPFSIKAVLFSDRGVQAFSAWGSGLRDYIERLKAFGTILADNVAGSSFIMLMVVLIPICLLIVGQMKKDCTKNPVTSSFLMTCIPALVYFLLAAKMSPYFVDRYIMAVFPMAALIIMWLWDLACGAYKDTVFTRSGCIAAAIVISVIQIYSMGGEHTYLYKGYGEQIEIAETYAAYPLVCFYDGYGFYENIVEMERYEQTMLVKADELQAMDEERIEITQEGYVTLIKYPGEQAGKEQLERVMEVFGGTDYKLLLSGGAFGDTIYLVTP